MAWGTSRRCDRLLRVRRLHRAREAVLVRERIQGGKDERYLMPSQSDADLPASHAQDAIGAHTVMCA